MKRITSRGNPTFKHLRKLAGSARERRLHNRTLLEGMHLLEAYVAHHGLPELLVLSERGMASLELRNFLEAHPHAETVLLDEALFGEVSDLGTPSGIMALIEITAERPPSADSGSCVMLDAIQDAGNLGSILRSAAAAGISDIHLGQGCAQAWSPRVLRAAMGAHFRLRLHEQADLAEALRSFPGTSVSTCPKSGLDLYSLDLSQPLAWLFGNEGAGLSAELRRRTTLSARIPMPGATESLNVAAAAAVCLFEEVRQKLRRKADDGGSAEKMPGKIDSHLS